MHDVTIVSVCTLSWLNRTDDQQSMLRNAYNNNNNSEFYLILLDNSIFWKKVGKDDK